MSSLDADSSLHTLFVDFWKAFDLVNHNVLNNKLNIAFLTSYYSGSALTVRLTAASLC